MTVTLVPHFHWDREWYRPVEQFRARLVDAVDAVLTLLDADPGFCFTLDGQSIVVEDYLAVRPDGRADLSRHVAEERLAVGPWYVQPDSLLPSGESHVRNLLTGRRVAREVGPASAIAYLPDSFGHPATLPTLFAGFGLAPFVAWRGYGDEIEGRALGWRWEAPDGTVVPAVRLPEGYFDAACLADDVDAAADALAEVVGRRRSEHPDEPVVLMNGVDHMLPDAHTAAVVEALAARLGEPVVRGRLEDAVAGFDAADTFRGELLGGRVANLLPGVWSTRTPQKVRHRRVETMLTGWAEPWAALGAALGLPDERPSLDRAWRHLLRNQAHDSICGCSTDAVHRRMEGRFDDAEGLASETTARVLERLAGRGPQRRVPWTEAFDVAVFNASPHPRTDVVRVPLDPHPGLLVGGGRLDVHPFVLAGLDPPGYTVDGRPGRVVTSDDNGRVRWLPGQRAIDLEVVVADVPAFGCRRVRVEPSAPAPDEVDEGREISTDGVRVVAADDGTLTVEVGGHRWTGLLALDDQGDRGDSYDFDPVGDAVRVRPSEVHVSRRVHPSGIAELEVERVLPLPSGLEPDREQRAATTVADRLRVTARLVPGVARVDLDVALDHTARDHRLRLVLPTGEPTAVTTAATTFAVATRPTATLDRPGWEQPPPRTFPHQGWVRANRLTVVAPGLPEAEVTPDGTILLTLVRAVGWLSRFDLRSRPMPAGPVMEAPDAQVPGPVRTRLALLADAAPRGAADAELGLWGVVAGDEAAPDVARPLIELDPADVVLTACKPAHDGDGMVLRVWNPGAAPVDARLRLGFPTTRVESVRLDESPDDGALSHEDGAVRVAVAARGLRTLRVLTR